VDEQPEAARALQVGHVGRLGQMSGQENALSCLAPAGLVIATENALVAALYVPF
jgi:hypothetical protein